MKRVLVTGGAGFIGSSLSERLLAEGYLVVIVDNLNKYYSAKIKLANLKKITSHRHSRMYKVDIRDYKKLQEIFNREKPQIVVHLAAEVGVRASLKQPEEYLRTNVGGTQNLLELGRDVRVKQFILGSSSSVYGKRMGNRGFKETDAVKPVSPYAVTKAAAEQLCQAYASAYGIKTTVLRFFTVYGPRNRPDMACYQFVDSIASGKPVTLFGRNTRRDFTYVADIVDGIVKAIRTPLSYEVINLGNSSPVTITQLVRLIEKQLGKKAWLKHAPLPAADVPMTFANTHKAKKLLKWKPQTSIEMGVEKLVAWYSNQSKL